MFTFNQLLQEGHDIIALQETHCGNNDLKLWEKEWPGLSKWNTYSTRLAGVAILSNPILNVKILDTQMDFNGRVLQLTVKIDYYNFQILNVYASNPETQEESEGFMSDVQYYLDPTLPALISGDFNMVENLKLNRKGSKPRGLDTFGIEAQEKLKSDYSLIDIWWEIHPNKREFSWHSRYDNIPS